MNHTSESEKMMKIKKEEIVEPNLNQSNLVDLELRAKSQFIYALVGVGVLLFVGIVAIVCFASYLSVQNSVLIGTGVLFGIVILLLVAFDMKAKMRGINSHRDEQSTMSDLYEKYKSASEALSLIHI